MPIKREVKLKLKKIYILPEFQQKTMADLRKIRQGNSFKICQKLIRKC